MLSAKKLKELKKELDDCHNPVFIYDKDCDGLCSFLLFHHYKKAGTGMPLMTKNFDESFANRIMEEKPDKVFFLDIPTIPEEFIKLLKLPCVQVDHHLGGLKIKGLKIFNPRDAKKTDGSPTSTICYNVVKQNLWLCAIGTIADWHITKETKAYAKERPDLLDVKIKDPGHAMFESKVGLLGRIFNFILKGKSDDVKNLIKTMKKIKLPDEILSQTTSDGEEIWKRYYGIQQRYKEIYELAEKQITKKKLVVFMYPGVRHGEGELSFTSELSNELLHYHRNKIIVIAREKNEEMKCSVRSGSIEIRTKLLKALKTVGGTGGGHTHACGATIKKDQFEIFLKTFEKLI